MVTVMHSAHLNVLLYTKQLKLCHKISHKSFSKFTHSLTNINPSVAMFSNQTLVVPSTVMLNCHSHKVLMCVYDKVRELHMQQCHSFTQQIFQIRSFAKKSVLQWHCLQKLLQYHDTVTCRSMTTQYYINEQSSCEIAELARCRSESLKIIVNHLVLYCCLHEGE